MAALIAAGLVDDDVAKRAKRLRVIVRWKLVQMVKFAYGIRMPAGTASAEAMFKISGVSVCVAQRANGSPPTSESD